MRSPKSSNLSSNPMGSGHNHPHDDDHAHEHDHDHGHDHPHEHGDHKKQDHAHHGHDHSHGGHDHAHGHGHSHIHTSNETRLLATLIISSLFLLVEVAAGIYAGSLALIADAGHMLTDAAALAMAYAAIRIGRRPADELRSYGYERLQVLSAFVNGLSLLLIAAWIFVEAVSRLLAPVQVLGVPMLIVATGGFAVNFISFLILHGGERENINMSGAIAHVLGDLAGSAAAMVAAGVILLTRWMPADPLLSMVVAALILRTGWKLTRQSAHVLLEGAPDGFDVASLSRELPLAVSGVSDIHHIHVWMLTPQKTMMTLHARLTGATDADQATRAIGDYLRGKHGIAHATIQIERDECAEPHH